MQELTGLSFDIQVTIFVMSVNEQNIIGHLSRLMRKPVFGVSDQIPQKQGCINTEKIHRGLKFWIYKVGFFGLVLCLTSQSTNFQSFWDRATASWALVTSTLVTLKCLAQGHYTAVLEFEP